MAFIKCSGGGDAKFETVIKYHQSGELTMPNYILSGTISHSGKLLVNAYVYVDSGRIPILTLDINGTSNTDYYYTGTINHVNCKMWQLDVNKDDTYSMTLNGNGASLRLNRAAFGYLIY